MYFRCANDIDDDENWLEVADVFEQSNVVIAKLETFPSSLCSESNQKGSSMSLARILSVVHQLATAWKILCSFCREYHIL